ncbi:hypothetical protein ACWGI9_41285 [Streptomyces sp. NPDC054833]
MVLSSLFARRPADPATWTPPGMTVVQRYRNSLGEREGAIVLVYTAVSERSSSYAVACLGCTYRAARNGSRTRLTEAEAAALANTHALNCRAIDRGVPAAPDDARAAQIVRDRLSTKRGTAPHHVRLVDFHEDRVDLQRDDDFIKQVMFEIVRAEGDFLTAQPGRSGIGTCFMLQPYPARA